MVWGLYPANNCGCASLLFSLSFFCDWLPFQRKSATDSTAQTALASHRASIVTACGTAQMAPMSSTVVSPLPALVDSNLLISAVPGTRVLDLQDELGKAQREGCVKKQSDWGVRPYSGKHCHLAALCTISCPIIFTWALPSSARLALLMLLLNITWGMF